MLTTTLAIPASAMLCLNEHLFPYLHFPFVLKLRHGMTFFSSIVISLPSLFLPIRNSSCSVNRDRSLSSFSSPPSSLLPWLRLRLSSFELCGVSFSDASASELVAIETLSSGDKDLFFFFVFLSATFLVGYSIVSWSRSDVPNLFLILSTELTFLRLDSEALQFSFGREVNRAQAISFQKKTGHICGIRFLEGF